ncbi:putative ferric-chelate reductase 1 [Pomacea canaliculata]|uniref:putative ferric-chelate reductase 1 n=1 Tax=Pomacea canaliculata TaxID=400727 RepID=UPI000D725EF7|nr:putative ferric-chelate reductase 1 [Pomacea canaliculata]
MNEASVTECILNTNSLQAFMSSNKDYGNEKISPDPKVGLSQVSGTLEDGVLSCSFHRALVVAGRTDIYDLTAQKYHVMMARGTASGWDITPHDQSDAFVTSDSYNLTLPVDIGAKSESQTLVKLHGCLMTLAWIMAGSVGLLMARFYKDAWKTKTLCGVKVWFAIHRACMVATFFATALGFALIFIKLEATAR